MSDNIKSLRAMLEPSALHPSFGSQDDTIAWESEIEASKAISLKRIADALWGDPMNCGIVQLLNGIEMNGRVQ